MELRSLTLPNLYLGYLENHEEHFLVAEDNNARNQTRTPWFLSGLDRRQVMLKVPNISLGNKSAFVSRLSVNGSDEQREFIPPMFCEDSKSVCETSLGSSET
ncbi:MAG: hypothetical protein V4627_15840 [Pseudomonadota bacterium]